MLGKYVALIILTLSQALHGEGEVTLNYVVSAYFVNEEAHHEDTVTGAYYLRLTNITTNSIVLQLDSGSVLQVMVRDGGVSTSPVGAVLTAPADGYELEPFKSKVIRIGSSLTGRNVAPENSYLRVSLDENSQTKEFVLPLTVVDSASSILEGRSARFVDARRNGGATQNRRENHMNAALVVIGVLCVGAIGFLLFRRAP